MSSLPRQPASPLRFVPGALALLALIATRLYSRALFHAMAELFAVAVQFSLFTIVWHSRRRIDSGALVFVGASAASVAALDALHMLTYEGAGLLPATPAVPTQLWIAARLIQAASLFVASRSGGRTPAAWRVLTITSAVAATAVAVIATGLLPALLGDAGLASLRSASGLAAVLMLIAAMHGFSRKPASLAPAVSALVRQSVAAASVSQIMITLSPDSASAVHVVGHLLRIIAAYALYRAVVLNVLEEPQALLFREISLRNARLEDAQRALRRAKERSDTMSAVASMVARGDEIDAVIARAFELCSRALSADGATITSAGGAGHTVTHAYGFDNAMMGFQTDVEASRHLRLALEKRAPVIINDPVHDPRVDRSFIARFGIRALITAPLVAGNEVFGVLTFVKRTGRGGFDEHDRGLVGRLATALALAMSNERLRASQARVADALRSAILSMPDALPGVRIGHVYRSADRLARIGGDFYDAFPVAEGVHAFLMGDVSGKGVDAAASSFVTRTAFHALALRESSPAAVMAAVNDVLARLLPEGAFATAVFGLLDTRSGVFTASSAGHPDPLVCADGRCIEYDSVRSMPLGMFADAVYEEFTISLERDHTLVLFSDGVLDARRGQEPFGEDRVRETLDGFQTRDPQSVAERLLTAVVEHADGSHVDDIAIVALRLE